MSGPARPPQRPGRSARAADHAGGPALGPAPDAHDQVAGEDADAGKRDEALTALRAASRQLDKAASKGVIHANQAANKKSAMALRAKSL